MLCFVGLHACPSVILPWLFFYVRFFNIFFIDCPSVFARKAKTMFSSNKFPCDLFFFIFTFN